MANYTYTKIIVEGELGRLEEFDKKLSSIEVSVPEDPSTISFIKEVLKSIPDQELPDIRIQKSTIDSKTLAGLLGWNPDQITQIEAIESHAIVNNTLHMEVSARYCKPVFLLEMLNKEFPSSVYYYSEEWMSQYFVTNDQAGKYFPERVFVKLCNKHGWFTSEAEAAQYIERETGIQTDPNYDSIMASLEKYWGGYEIEMYYKISVETL